MSDPEKNEKIVADSELSDKAVAALRAADLPNPTSAVFLQAERDFHTADQDGDTRTYEQIVVDAVRASQSVITGADQVGKELQSAASVEG